MKAILNLFFGKQINAIRQKWNNEEKEKMVRISALIPRYELSSVHLQNAKLIANRSELLELLPKESICAEIGVNEGEFSEEILNITKPTKLYLIDAWNDSFFHNGKKAIVEEKFSNQMQYKKVELRVGLSTDELPKFPDGYFDWVYLDTAHTYEITYAELSILKTKIKPNGIILGHDYVIGNWADWFKYGVIEAVHEFCVKEGWEIIYLTNETHQHRSFAIKKLV
ncbi:MAG: hypothetical protein RL596_2021 [Bacteroidota bacterium]|jgi:hypothetical protein